MSGLKQLSELKRLEVRFGGVEHMFTRSAGCSTLILESPLVIMKTSLK